MRNISERLLRCSAEAFRNAGMDADRNVAWSEPEALSRVWITRTDSWADSSGGKADGDAMTLFFDTALSEPRGWTPEEGMRVRYMDRDYYVQGFSPCMCPDGLHHWEVTLR